MSSRAARSRVGLILILLIASGVVHVGLLRVLPGAQRVLPDRRTEFAPISLTIEAPNRVPASRNAPRHLDQMPRRSRAHVAAPEAAPNEPPQPAAQLQEPAAAQPEPAAPVPVPAPAPASVVDLSPRGVALGALPSPSAPAPHADEDLASRRGAELSADLRVIANAGRVRPPRVLKLERDPDGTCHYTGDAIDATILPDGSVEFADKPPRVAVTPIASAEPGHLLSQGGPAPPPGSPMTPDDLVAPQRLEYQVKVSARAWQAERAWFLRESEGVRRDLEDATHAHSLVRGEAQLRKQLDRVWCDATKPVASRRRLLFELWDDTSDDEVGERGRRVILEYIRTNLPPGSTLAFPSEQLGQLNRARQQRVPFEPYAALDVKASPDSPTR